MTINSMTAYGYGETTNGDYCYTTEIRSLNSRFIEVNVRLPRVYIAFEADIIKLIKKSLSRGKVDVFIDISLIDGKRQLPELDADAAKHYLSLSSELAKLSGQIDGQTQLAPLDTSHLMKLDGVLNHSSRDQKGPEAIESQKTPIFESIKLALGSLVEFRQKEGHELVEAVKTILEEITNDSQAVEDKRSHVQEQLKANFLKRLNNAIEVMKKQEGAADIPKERLASEIAILSDKLDIEEEVTRLKTHINEFTNLIATGGVVGRKFVFLCQEMHREVNTMSNKLNHTEISKHTLELKQNVERIRQQIQNIE